ncbi:MAG: hypothetical protein K6E84_00800 [Lachnospiraceae bacterium]|nr:hypothetical protein [Lachnospiraceae bacterium]
MRKMRRSTLYVIFTVMFTLSLVGCGKSPAEDVDATADPSTEVGLLEPGGEAWDVVSSQELSQDPAQQDEAAQQPGEEEAGQQETEDRTSDEDVAATADDTVDLDLTNLSSTMVYSEVYNMMTVPEDYIGKTIKMNGTYVYYKDATTGNEYFSCIIQDATACCSQGIEFILTEDYRYPDDYPAEGTTICVSGVFDTYEENGVKYCTLRNARLV